MKKIGITTTGGDAPGMNAAIRAITRLAVSNNIEVIGYEKGWDGLYKNQYRQLDKRSVGGILHTGGTILQTSRTDVLRSEDGKKQVADNIHANEIDGLVVIGGNGSMKAAQVLSQVTDTKIVGIPATIDNDIYGSQETIGFDTAVNTAVQMIDKIRDTATSHDRIFITEVMGRKNGHIALAVGLAVGAEVILVPEQEPDYAEIFRTIKTNTAKGKKSGIIVTAEGVADSRDLAARVEARTDATVRISILGYTQRGGHPTARSRLLANLFSREAINLLLSGNGGKLVRYDHGDISPITLEEVTTNMKEIDYELLNTYQVLAS